MRISLYAFFVALHFELSQPEVTKDDVPAIGLTFMLGEETSNDAGGISTKSFLSSLIAVSTRALSLLDSVTYPRLPLLLVAATRAAR
jgi:hypothetical protein